MNRTSTRRWLWPLLGLAVLAVLVVLIKPAFSSSMLTPSTSDTADVVVAVEASPVDAAVADSETASLVVEDLEQALEAFADVPSSDNCITCHTDKELLQAIAEEPEEVQSELASGEG